MFSMRSWKCRVLAATILVCGAMVSAAHASIVITGTRVIYPAQAREVNVRLKNVDEKPTLVQAWIDDGRASAAPSEIRVPFLMMPSVFRVEPDKGQSLRIMATGANFPLDRESVYWLNVLEIPPKPADSDQRNLMQIAFRTRIKMFYRPASLTDDPSAYRSKLTWKFASNDKGERVLRMENPSPYYISLNSVSLETNGKTVGLVPEMAPPFGHVDMKLAAGTVDEKASTVSFAVITDYGSEAKASAQIGSPAQAGDSPAKAIGAVQVDSTKKISDASQASGAVQADDAEKTKQVQ
jgi:chaperone protein EcpD